MHLQTAFLLLLFIIPLTLADNCVYTEKKIGDMVIPGAGNGRCVPSQFCVEPRGRPTNGGSCPSGLVCCADLPLIGPCEISKGGACVRAGQCPDGEVITHGTANPCSFGLICCKRVNAPPPFTPTPLLSSSPSPSPSKSPKRSPSPSSGGGETPKPSPSGTVEETQTPQPTKTVGPNVTFRPAASIVPVPGACSCTCVTGKRPIRKLNKQCRGISDACRVQKCTDSASDASGFKCCPRKTAITATAF